MVTEPASRKTNGTGQGLPEETAGLRPLRTMLALPGSTGAGVANWASRIAIGPTWPRAPFTAGLAESVWVFCPAPQPATTSTESPASAAATRFTVADPPSRTTGEHAGRVAGWSSRARAWSPDGGRQRPLWITRPGRITFTRRPDARADPIC